MSDNVCLSARVRTVASSINQRIFGHCSRYRPLLVASEIRLVSPAPADVSDVYLCYDPASDQ
jgi:hypothetical protein